MADELEGALVVIPVEKLVGWLDVGRARGAATNSRRAATTDVPPLD